MKFVYRVTRFLWKTPEPAPALVSATTPEDPKKTAFVSMEPTQPAGFMLQRITPYASPKKEDTVIGDDAVMTGTLKVAGRVIVEGRMSGVIEQQPGGANVFVDEEAVFRGEIYASNTLIYGLVEGAVTSTRISIEKTAKVTGLIEYKEIRIKGGLFGAKLQRNTTLPLLIEDKETKLAISI